jgi:hypothetical protein
MKSKIEAAANVIVTVFVGIVESVFLNETNHYRSSFVGRVWSRKRHEEVT